MDILCDELFLRMLSEQIIVLKQALLLIPSCLQAIAFKLYIRWRFFKLHTIHKLEWTKLRMKQLWLYWKRRLLCALIFVVGWLVRSLMAIIRRMIGFVETLEEAREHLMSIASQTWLLIFL